MMDKTNNFGLSEPSFLLFQHLHVLCTMQFSLFNASPWMLPQLTVNSLHSIKTLRNILISGQMQDAGQSYKMHWHLGLENSKISLQIISSNKSHWLLKNLGSNGVRQWNCYPHQHYLLMRTSSIRKAICIKAFLI